MVIKHFVITRFLSEDFGHSKEDMFSEEWISKGIHMLKKHFIPTLENQTNHNFENIIIIHDEVPMERIKELYSLESFIKCNIVRNSNIDDFINKYKDKCDVMITSRFDWDDNINKCVVDDIQNFIISNPNKFILYGLNNGCTIIDGETEAFFKPKIRCENTKCGFWSAMITYSMPNSLCERFYNVYDIGNHTMIINNIRENYNTFGIKDISNLIVHMDDSEEIKYLWVRHDFSESVMRSNSWHSSNDFVKLNLSEDFAYNV